MDSVGIQADAIHLRLLSEQRAGPGSPPSSANAFLSCYQYFYLLAVLPMLRYIKHIAKCVSDIYKILRFSKSIYKSVV